MLVAALAAPVLAVPFRIQENRSLEAAVRYFGSTTVGASLGIASLALAAQQPQSIGEERLPLTLLLVMVIATFALLLGTVPFHLHLAALTSEAQVRTSTCPARGAGRGTSSSRGVPRPSRTTDFTWFLP